ncbi:MAG: DNA-protecting protein DprA [Hyphomicrobiales bacterium]|nr:DNA-protecting protein DprA [Hyphomicrobiales bacterium]
MPNIELTNAQRLDWLQLIRSENVGPATFRDLIKHFGTAAHALEALPELSNRAGKKAIKIFPRERAELEFNDAARLSITHVGMCEAAYPQYLKSIDYPPPILSIRGRLDINKCPPVGIVGARNCSASGVKLATSFVKALGKIPYYIVSGFARGIDIAAHQAALDTGTICVLAGGVNNIYPSQHDQFYTNFLDQGSVFVSEMPLNYRPRAIDFPRRNRIIAGIGLGVIVIEASVRSGSLITARLANEAGRLVFAIPGSPLDSRSAGGNLLLKKGAIIATDPSDISDEIDRLLEKPIQTNLFGTDKFSLEDNDPFESENNDTPDIITDTSNNNRNSIIEALGSAPIEIDELVRHCQVPVSHVQLVLIELSLAGRIEYHPGNKVSLIMDG